MFDVARALLPPSLVRRVATLRRDVVSIASRLDGRAPPPFSLRVATSPSRGPAPRGLVARRARVVEVVRETADAASILLVDVEGRPFEHAPGQFLTIQVDVDGAPTRRAYSIAWSSDDQRQVAIGVKRVAGGRVSSRLVDALRVGDVLEVLGPSGAFTPEASVASALLIGGGSGITPLRRIAEALLARSPTARVALVLANRSANDVMFGGALRALAERHPGRFALVEVHDVLSPGAALLGPLDGEVLDAALASLPFQLGSGAPAFLCGPDGLMRVARAALERRGFAPGAIFEERFASPEPPAPRAALGAAASASATASPITFRRKDGSVVVVASPRTGATVLEAGLEANVPLGYSCAMGGCGACRVKLSAGEVSMLTPHCLDDDERAAGLVLACVATAVGPVTVEVGA